MRTGDPPKKLRPPSTRLIPPRGANPGHACAAKAVGQRAARAPFTRCGRGRFFRRPARRRNDRGARRRRIAGCAAFSSRPILSIHPPAFLQDCAKCSRCRAMRPKHAVKLFGGTEFDGGRKSVLVRSPLSRKKKRVRSAARRPKVPVAHKRSEAARQFTKRKGCGQNDRAVMGKCNLRRDGRQGALKRACFRR